LSVVRIVLPFSRPIRCSLAKSTEGSEEWSTELSEGSLEAWKPGTVLPKPGTVLEAWDGPTIFHFPGTIYEICFGGLKLTTHLEYTHASNRTT
jgi:hypothetical protein